MAEELFFPPAPDELFAIGQFYKPVPDVLSLDDEHLAEYVNQLVEAHTIEERYRLPQMLETSVPPVP